MIEPRVDVSFGTHGLKFIVWGPADFRRLLADEPFVDYVGQDSCKASTWGRLDRRYSVTGIRSRVEELAAEYGLTCEIVGLNELRRT